MTSRSWAFILAILCALCGLVFKNLLCEVIFVVTLLVLFGSRDSTS